MKERNVITHYSINDLAYGIYLEKAIEIGRKIIIQNDYDLLDILNLFEINLYLDDYNLLNETGQNLLKQLIDEECKINLIIGRYFNNVNESNLIQILLEVKDNYYAKNTLLKCFDKSYENQTIKNQCPKIQG